jgi:hypothetical protein
MFQAQPDRQPMRQAALYQLEFMLLPPRIIEHRLSFWNSCRHWRTTTSMPKICDARIGFAG